jgi:Cd2+/Zn2+-exporting ATPase
MIGRFSKLGTYQELLERRALVLCLLGGALAVVAGLWQWRGLSPEFAGAVLALAAVAINGVPIIIGAAKGLWERRVNVDELVSIAIIATLFQGEFLSAALISFIMTLGALVEELISESSRRSIQSLAKMTPDHANLVDGNDVRIAPVSEIAISDKLLIRPGERVPVDGVVVSGSSAVDESAITGESMPRDKMPGDPLLAGTLNHSGVLEIEATRVGEDTTMGKVAQLVSEAEAETPKTARFIDRYAQWFTPIVLICAGLAWAITGQADRAVAVLVAGCPCALLMAAPTAAVAAVARAARSGILVKGGRRLEQAAAVDTVLFDKTGTLTLGEPRVEEIHPGQGYTKGDILSWAACAERDSTHPLAKAVLKAAHYARVAVHRAESMVSETGKGVKAMFDGSCIAVGAVALGGNRTELPVDLRDSFESIRERGSTPLIVWRDDKPVGIFGVTDKVREQSIKTIDEFKSMGVDRLGIVSGDHARSVSGLARKLGITETWSELMPEGKLKIIDDLRSRGRRIMFVGDGVNDAPALARAEVGVAMGAAGSDVALETSDIALTYDDISKLPFLLRLSRRMLRLIKVNIFLGLLFNTIAVFGGADGWLSPISASLFHNIGSIIVVSSSVSLLFFERNNRTGA